MGLWLKLPKDWGFIWETRGILDLRWQILDFTGLPHEERRNRVTWQRSLVFKPMIFQRNFGVCVSPDLKEHLQSQICHL
jgi:hypothetical protein